MSKKNGGVGADDLEPLAPASSSIIDDLDIQPDPIEVDGSVQDFGEANLGDAENGAGLASAFELVGGIAVSNQTTEEFVSTEEKAASEVDLLPAGEAAVKHPPELLAKYPELGTKKSWRFVAPLYPQQHFRIELEKIDANGNKVTDKWETKC